MKQGYELFKVGLSSRKRDPFPREGRRVFNLLRLMNKTHQRATKMSQPILTGGTNQCTTVIQGRPRKWATVLANLNPEEKKKNFLFHVPVSDISFIISFILYKRKEKQFNIKYKCSPV